MNQAAAGEVLLLRAFETTGGTPWTEDDAAWASRSALQAVGSDAPADAFLAARAQAGLRRLAAREPALAGWTAQPPAWAGLLPLGLGMAAFVLGLAVDRIGSGQGINLLAPPIWALLAWNLGAYAVLLWAALRHRAPAGPLRSALQAALRRAAPKLPTASPWASFAADWSAARLPLQGARLAQALHLGAALLAAGVIAGLYLRGLVLDYRVSWQSTFLDAAAVQSLLGGLLAPAAALSGISLPDLAGWQALRGPLPADAPGASAAPWIHLYALTLLGAVVLPRLLLAGAAALRAGRLQRQFPLPLHEPYFQRLLRQHRGQALPVRLWPHARAPEAAARSALQRLLAGAFGPGAVLHIAPTVAYGSEEAPADLPPAGTLRLVLCDLGATPEPESQGRLLQALTPPGGVPPWLLLDEAAFRQRFGATSPRLTERRQAWRTLAEGRAAGIVFATLQDGADLAEAEAALQAAQAA